MQKQKRLGGCFVYTSSAAAAIVSPFTVLYAATKSFVSAFGASLAAEGAFTIPTFSLRTAPFVPVSECRSAASQFGLRMLCPVCGGGRGGAGVLSRTCRACLPRPSLKSRMTGDAANTQSGAFVLNTRFCEGVARLVVQ